MKKTLVLIPHVRPFPVADFTDHSGSSTEEAVPEGGDAARAKRSYWVYTKNHVGNLSDILTGFWKN